MRRTTIAIAAGVALALGVITMPAQAGSASTGTITVSGVGSTVLTRDRATTNLTVSLTAARAVDAMAQATSTYNAVRKAVIAAGVKSTDLTTTGISLYPEYEYPANGGKPVISGYRASMSVQARSTVPVAAAVLDAATTTGGDAVTVGGISFDVADPDAVADTSRARAVTNARMKARDYAKALGQHVGRAIKIIETSSSTPTPVYAPVAKAGADAIELDPGTDKVTSSVTITFQLLR